MASSVPVSVSTFSCPSVRSEICMCVYGGGWHLNVKLMSCVLSTSPQWPTSCPRLHPRCHRRSPRSQRPRSPTCCPRSRCKNRSSRSLRPGSQPRSSSRIPCAMRSVYVCTSWVGILLLSSVCLVEAASDTNFSPSMNTLAAAAVPASFFSS